MAVNVPAAYKSLVKMVAYSFYAGECPPKHAMGQDKKEDKEEGQKEAPMSAAVAKRLAQVRQ